MSLGGGTFTAQNKVLPGAYINFVSASKVSTSLSERGIVALAMELDFGKDKEVMKITAEDFAKNSLAIFGYDYTHEKMKGLRDLFKNATVAYIYKLNEGVKASNKYATAKYSGVKGNDIKIIVQANVDDEDKFDVTTMLGDTKVDTQTVSAASELVANDFVTFKTDATLEATAGIALAGGTNGTITGANHQDFLNKIEGYSFNGLGCISKEENVIKLYVEFTKRMRENTGLKFQTVVYNHAADYEGVVNLKNKAVEDDLGLVFYTLGIVAGCAINKSNTNSVYKGEYTPVAEYTQAELENAILAGEFVYHKVGEEIRVLEDINSLVTVTNEKGEDFKANQTIRVLDQIATDVAVLFNTKYHGKIQNNDAGRVSLWSDVIALYREYVTMQAIENFESEDITIAEGETKKSVVINGAIQVINSMEKLYMSIVVA